MVLNQNLKKLLAALAILVVVMVVTGVILNGGILDRMQLQLSSLLYQTRTSSTPVVIVGVDQKTVEELGQTASWTRDIYAQVIKNLNKHNPAVIGLDYFFTSKSKVVPISKLEGIINESESSAEIVSKLETVVGGEINEYDQALAREIKDSKNLIVINPPQGNFSAKVEKNDQFVANEPFSAFIPEEIDRIGHINVLTEDDGSIRKYIPAIPGSRDYLSFGLAVINTYFGGGLEIVNFSADNLKVRAGSREFDMPLKDYQFLINFSSETLRDNLAKEINQTNSNYKYLSFTDVYNERWDDLNPEELAGKIVLIGPYLQSGDNYKVPLNQDYRMWGVQIHAQAIQTILDGAWLRDMGAVEIMLAGTILAMICLGLVFWLRVRFAIPAAAAMLIIYCGLIGWVMFRMGLIINLVYPPLAMILAVITGYSYRYVTEFRQKMKVAGALGQYVNTEVAEKVLQGNQAIGQVGGGEKKNITVLFTDIAGFTNISEGLQAVSLVALLNEYFEVMSAVVVRNGGLVDKYIGDALMAVYQGERHELKAVQTALEMRVELENLLKKWQSDSPLPGGEMKPAIDFRAGISSGEAVLGNIGSTEHLQFTVIGDIVNLGSRLEGANKKYSTRIMIAEATFEKIKDQFVCRFLDVIKVKGKNKQVDVYEVISEKGLLSTEMADLLSAYNRGLEKYFAFDFQGALKIFEEEILGKWPKDYLSNIYAARCHRLVLFPPPADWDFVFKMESK